MPAPLTPPECDLQDFPFMPLHVARLRDSDLANEESAEACWYAVLLWAISWHQVPAASLPDNDASLTRLLGLGKDVRTFRKHKAAAMRNFVLCDDGRLYHPVVAEAAMTAWEGKLQQRWRTECARIKKANQRNETDLPLPTFAEFMGEPVPDPCPETVPGDTSNCPEGQGVQEKGKEKGTGIIEEGGGGGRDEVADDWPNGDHGKLLVAAAESPWLDPNKSLGLITDAGRLDAWRRRGASWTKHVLPVVTAIAKQHGEPISTWKFFQPAVTRAVAASRAEVELPEGVVPLRPGTGPPSWADRISEDNRQANELAFQMLDAQNGRSP